MTGEEDTAVGDGDICTTVAEEEGGEVCDGGVVMGSDIVEEYRAIVVVVVKRVMTWYDVMRSLDEEVSKCV